MTTTNTITAPEIRISYFPNMDINDRPIVKDSADTVAIMRQHWDENFYEIREEARMLLLAPSLRVLGIFNLSIGSLNKTVVDPAMIFLIAASTPGVKSIVLAHNHPSGTKNPSRTDIELTQRIRAGALLLGLELVDHLILTRNSYLSMADQGML